MANFNRLLSLASLLISLQVFAFDKNLPNTPKKYQHDMLGAADTKNVGLIVVACTACHSFKKGEPNFGGPSGKVYVGPNLFGVVGREIASLKGYNYSRAFKKLKGKSWTVEELDKFLKRPTSYVPGTLMRFNGLLDPQDRMDVIAYLMTIK
jgi:cytochrome c